MENLDLAWIAGVILSLLFRYVPGFTDFFKRLSDEERRLFMLLFVVLSGITIYILSCWDSEIFTQLTCDRRGFVELMRLILATAVSNQTTYLLVKAEKRDG